MRAATPSIWKLKHSACFLSIVSHSALSGVQGLDRPDQYGPLVTFYPQQSCHDADAASSLLRELKRQSSELAAAAQSLVQFRNELAKARSRHHFKTARSSGSFLPGNRFRILMISATRRQTGADGKRLKQERAARRACGWRRHAANYQSTRICSRSLVRISQRGRARFWMQNRRRRRSSGGDQRHQCHCGPSEEGRRNRNAAGESGTQAS